MLDNGLNELLSETFYQIKFVFKNHYAEKYFSIFELALSELEFSNLTNFFHYWFNFTFQFFIKSHYLNCTVDRVWAVDWLRFFIIVFSIDHIINLADFLCDCYFWSISFVIYNDSFPWFKRNIKGMKFSKVILLFVVFFAQHYFLFIYLKIFCLLFQLFTL